ncbi:MAG TPA: glutathione peroxidase [Bacteriovoracaceae bacterium]|nr:glutathione peroxidase [Bacteriovoracaceae bacterium]
MRFLLALIVLTTTAFAQEIYQIKDKSIDGKEFPMSQLKGKTVLIVNIASQCGFTSQLEKLETLYKKYKSKNFVVLGVPTNDFGGQTPQDDKALAEFCQKNYSASFPILSKKSIKGEGKRDLYKYLTKKTPQDIKGEVAWNFEKFLVNKKGEVIGKFGSSADPMDKAVTEKIESIL